MSLSPPPSYLHTTNVLKHEDMDTRANLVNSVPAWGSYLYQNFLLPSISPSEWLNPPSSANQAASGGIHDYFNQSQDWATLSAEVKVEPAEVPQPAVSPTIQSEPSSLFPQHYYYNPVVPTSLLMAQSSSSQTVSSSVDHVDAEVTRSPSPLSSESSPQHSPMRGIKRRTSSMDSDLDDEHETEHEHDHDVPEGVERDGIIWGMKVEDYRSMSARERKRVRNRISARTFRAKRKEHLTSLESTLGAKVLQIKLGNEETARLRREVHELKRRLSKYEAA